MTIPFLTQVSMSYLIGIGSWKSPPHTGHINLSAIKQSMHTVRPQQTHVLTYSTFFQQRSHST